MNLEELQTNYEEQEENSESERGSYSGAGSPESPRSSGGSPCPSCNSSSSDSSQNSLILDTNVFLPIKSVQVMAETVGVELDDESAAIISQSAINKLRHLTLLAYQFSRHSKSKGVRVSDFTKAEKILDSSFSLGYGFTQKLPEYLDVGDVCIEYEGPDIELHSKINKPSINEIRVDTSVDPVLISHYANFHDKLSQDFEEDRLFPDFSQLLKDLSFNHGSPQDCKTYKTSKRNNDSSLNCVSRLPPCLSSNTAPDLLFPFPTANSNVALKCKVNDEFSSHISFQNVERVNSLSNINVSSHNGESSQVFGAEAKSFYNKKERSEIEESDVIFSFVNVAKKFKIETETLDELGHVEDSGVSIKQIDSVDDSMAVKFEPMEIENDSILFEQNGMIKTESDILQHGTNQSTDAASARSHTQRTNGGAVLKKEICSYSNSRKNNNVSKQSKIHKDLSPRSLQMERDSYTRGDFLRHQDVLGDQIFSEDTMSNDSVSPDDSGANEVLIPVSTPSDEDDEATQMEDLEEIDNFEVHSESCIEVDKNKILLNIFKGEEFIGVTHADEVTPPGSVNDLDEITELTEVTDVVDQHTENPESESSASNNGTEYSEIEYQEEDNTNPSRNNNYFEENVNGEEAESTETDDRDNEEEDDGPEEDRDVAASGYLPAEWGIYLQNFLVAFFDKEKSYETFEKISYSYYIDEEDEEDIPIPDDFQVLLKDIEQNGVFPILHIVCEFFHNFMGGKYNYVGSKQLRRITSFIDTTLSCPIHPKVFHLKPMLAILIDMLITPVPCKLQACVTKSILKIADFSEQPFNLELIRWITYFIIGVLESSSRLTLAQLTPSIKSRICAAIYLALGYDSRGLRLQRMHTWVKYVIMISNNHHLMHQISPEIENPRIKLDPSDSYLEEAILRFIRVYVKNYHNGCPDNNFMPLLQCALDNYGEKLSKYLSTVDYFDVSSKDFTNRQCKTRKTAHSNENEDEIVTEFLVRPGWMYSTKQFTKLKIPYAMCVL